MRSLITLTLVGLVFYGCGPSGSDEESTSLAASDAEDEHEEHDEGEEGHVELTAEQVQSADIRTATAQVSPTASLVSSISSRTSRMRFSTEPPYSSLRLLCWGDRNWDRRYPCVAYT